MSSLCFCASVAARRQFQQGCPQRALGPGTEAGDREFRVSTSDEDACDGCHHCCYGGPGRAREIKEWRSSIKRGGELSLGGDKQDRIQWWSRNPPSKWCPNLTNPSGLLYPLLIYREHWWFHISVTSLQSYWERHQSEASPFFHSNRGRRGCDWLKRGRHVPDRRSASYIRHVRSRTETHSAVFPK